MHTNKTSIERAQSLFNTKVVTWYKVRAFGGRYMTRFGEEGQAKSALSIIQFVFFLIKKTGQKRHVFKTNSLAE